MSEETIPYVNEDLEFNQNAKMSEKVRWFMYDDDMSGVQEIISETNSVVADDDIEVQTMLDSEIGSKYFYACMVLAINVIKSFEAEQSKGDE